MDSLLDDSQENNINGVETLETLKECNSIL